jgi:hypothetical protein
MTFDFSKVHLAGQVMADLLAPLAIWLTLLSFLAVIVLLLGSESG